MQLTTLLALISLIACTKPPPAATAEIGAARAVAPRPAAPLLAIEAGSEHTCAIRFGALICWGSNSDGQLGTPSRQATAHTVFDSGVTALAVGAFHTCAVHLSAVKCWGANGNSQLGFSYTYLAPQTVPLADPG